MDMYFNLVRDTEGIFTDKGNKVLIFSSSKNLISETIDVDRIKSLSINLVPEMGNIYSYDNETIADSRLLFELKRKGFKKTNYIHIYEEEDEEEYEEKEDIVLKKYECTEIKPKDDCKIKTKPTYGSSEEPGLIFTGLSIIILISLFIVYPIVWLLM